MYLTYRKNRVLAHVNSLSELKKAGKKADVLSDIS